MALRMRRGMGATDTTPDNPCNSRWFWVNPACWDQSLFGNSKYPSPPRPPVVGSTLPDGSPIPVVPASGQAASDTIQAITNQQIAATQAGNQQFFEDLNTRLNPPESEFPWGWLAVAGVAVFGLAAVGGGSPRRYGR